MIFDGKSIQSVASKKIYPFLNNLLQSEDDTEIRESLNNIKILVDLGIEKKNFPGLQNLLYHKNVNIAHSSFDILRKKPSGVIQVEIKTNVLESMYPFFCKRALSTPSIAIDSLKILDLLIDHDIVGNYKYLQKALLHKSDRVAHLALNLLRKIKGLAIETKIGGLKLVAARGGAGKTRTIVGLIMNSLKNPKVPKFTQEIRNKVEK